MSDLLDLATLFQEPGHEGACCDCCAGYCPGDDAGPGDFGPQWPYLVAAMTVNGIDYISDRYAAVRRDLFTTPPDTVRVSEVSQPPAFPLAPKTPASTESSKPGVFYRLDGMQRLGIKRYDSTDPGLVHLYSGGAHIGWSTVTDPAKVTSINAAYVYPSEIGLVRKVAEVAAISTGDAARALRAIRDADAEAYQRGLSAGRYLR